MSKKTIMIGGGIALFIVISGVFSTFSKSENQQTTAQPVTPTVIPTKATIPQHKIIHNDDNGSVQNIYVQIVPTAISEATAKSIALDVDKANCTEKCNIYLYDDLVALGNEYDYSKNAANFTPQEDQTWQRKNYVYDADHFVAWIEFETPNDVQYYPLKNDSEYQKYKTQ